MSPLIVDLLPCIAQVWTLIKEKNRRKKWRNRSYCLICIDLFE